MEELLKVDRLEGHNWAQWKFVVKVHLKTSDLYGIVNGEEKKPVEGSGENVENKIKQWEKLDSRAQKVIVTTVGQQALLHIMNCNTAKEMWDKLHGIYEQKSESSIHLAQQKFYSYVMSEKDDIATHISKVEDLSQQLKRLGEPISESMMMTKILMTLPSAYNHFHSAWESTQEDKRNLHNLTTRLLIEEARLSTQSENKQSSNIDSGSIEALAAKKWNKPNNTKKMQKGKQKKPGKCFYCNKEGHWKNECRFRKMKNEKENATVTSTSKAEAFIVKEELVKESEENVWFLDSGATDHMSNRIEWFEDYEKFATPRLVRIGDGTLLRAEGKGDIVIFALVEDQWCEKHLKDVLYVPDIKLNLFSLSTVLEKGFTLSADSRNFKLIKNGRIAAEGIRRNRLYQLLIEVKSIECQVNVSDRISLQVWHERLAHQNFDHVRNVLKTMNIEVKATSKDNFCDACMYGKQHRLSFSSSSTKTDTCGEIIHTDLCGPMQVASVGGSNYFLLFKDDYSHFRTVYFLKNKSEVVSKLQEFLQFVKTLTGFNVKILRSDNGSEFNNFQVSEVLKKQGIRHQKTVPYSPEQNGCVEREMRTVVEAARTMIHARNLPIKLWAEAVNTAVYVLNRSGTSTVKNKTPFELWYNQEVAINDFKVFGTEVFAHVPKEKRRKWDTKSRKGVFVGYMENTKGYRIWYPNEDKVEISRDVFFKNEIQNKKENTIRLDEDSFENRTDDIVVRIESDSSQEVEEVIQENNTAETCDSMDDQNEETEFVEERKCQTYELRDRSLIQKPERFGSLAESVALLAEDCEPITYEEALNGKDAQDWKEAMNEEMDSLLQNKTWILTELPPNKQALPNRWVFKIKRKANGEIDRYKARLVVKGYCQKYNIDYKEVFSPVVRFESFRSILSVATKEGLKLAQFDIKTAFLYGSLKEEIYMQQPIGYKDGSSKVCKLNKSLYGLKQAPRCWNDKFERILTNYNLKVSQADSCVFLNNNNDKKLILAIYVDDGLVAATHQDDIDNLFKYLKDEFKIKTGTLDYYLGMEVCQVNDNTIFLNQFGYTTKILERFNMHECKMVSTPIEETTIKGNFVNAKEVVGVPYREAIGSLMYLSVVTRPDITFAVSVLSQYLEKPLQVHWNAVKRIFRYLKGTLKHGILIKGGESELHGFSDADFAGDINTRRSTTGYVFMFGSDVLAWCSRKQKSVSLSTTEAEYVAASMATTDLVWHLRLLNELLAPVKLKTPTLFVDNQSALKLIRNPQFHKRTKHIDVKYHYIREKYEEGMMNIEYVKSEDQLADIFTKALCAEKFRKFRHLLGVCQL